MSARYVCPCCGYRTLGEGPGSYDLCPVCYWEHDGMEADDAACINGPNGVTLAEGQRLYRRYGTSSLHCLRHVRRARPDEARDTDWRPLPSAADDDLPFFLSDLGRLLTTMTEEALDAARASRSDSDIARFEGLRAALSLLVRQADDFRIPRRRVGIDPQLRLGEDLKLDPPPGRFAG